MLVIEGTMRPPPRAAADPRGGEAMWNLPRPPPSASRRSEGEAAERRMVMLELVSSSTAGGRRCGCGHRRGYTCRIWNRRTTSPPPTSRVGPPASAACTPPATALPAPPLAMQFVGVNLRLGPEGVIGGGMPIGGRPTPPIRNLLQAARRGGKGRRLARLWIASLASESPSTSTASAWRNATASAVTMSRVPPPRGSAWRPCGGALLPGLAHKCLPP